MGRVDMSKKLAGTSRHRRELRVVLASLILCSCIALGLYGWVYGASVSAYLSYSPHEGDILFQSLPKSPLVIAIEGVTESRYSHCGIVSRLHGRWVVYEAFHGVEATPLREFLFRGRGHGFAAYRLTSDKQDLVPQMIDYVRTCLGKPYDVRYRMDDDHIYCSELIYKAYKHASNGEELGTLVRLGDLPWRPFEETIRHFERGPVPLDREMITPWNLSRAPQLHCVRSFRLPASH